MNYLNAFQRSAENLLYLRQSVAAHLAELPDGELRIYHHKIAGKDYPYYLYYPPEGRRKCIKKDEALLKDLALKMFLEQELFLLDELIAASNSAAESAKQATLSSILDRLPPEILPYLPFHAEENKSLLRHTASGSQRKSWENLPANANPYYGEDRRHRTSDGTFVKSKAELIIYEKLLQYKIDFKYEAPLAIGNTIYYPDFTIMLPDGRLLYWEHAGMMTVEAYRVHHKKKMAAYETAGIVPWKNLIVTYDDEDGNLDLRIVENEIKIKILDN